MARFLLRQRNMFLVARRKGQRIMIGQDIEVIVTSVTRSVVRIGIRAPSQYQILRGEIHDSIAEANRKAASSELATEPLVPAGGVPACEAPPAPVRSYALARVTVMTGQHVNGQTLVARQGGSPEPDVGSTDPAAPGPPASEVEDPE